MGQFARLVRIALIILASAIRSGRANLEAVAGSHPSVVSAARDALAPLLDGGEKRLLVGIVGAPAAGKSTLASTLARDLCRAHPRHAEAAGAEYAVAVGMDGFHLANAELSRLGLSATKGAPDTFDAYGFLALLRRLRAADEPVVYAPVYSRTLHESIGSAQPVRSPVRVVVVEGNYLLLPSPPWTEVAGLLDFVFYLDTPANVRIESLLRRQRSRGLDSAAAQDWVHRSDEANALLIAATRHRANVVLSRPR
jgi:pantothenate kinase